MEKFKLLFFSGCPNYEPAKELLKKTELDFIEVCQDNMDEMDSMKKYSSPTLLKGDRIIFGSKISCAEGACSLNLPSIIELVESVKEL